MVYENARGAGVVMAIIVTGLCAGALIIAMVAIIATGLCTATVIIGCARLVLQIDLKSDTETRDYEAESQGLQAAKARVPRYNLARVSNQTHVASTRMGHALVQAQVPLYKHTGFIMYMCDTLGLTKQSMLSLQQAAIPPIEMPSMSFAEWQCAGITEHDIMILLDFIFADTAPFCADCTDTAPFCAACKVYTRSSSVEDDWNAFVNQYYTSMKQTSSDAQELATDNAADSNSMF